MSRLSKLPLAFVIALLALALVAAACGSDDASSDATTTTPPTPPAAQATTTPPTTQATTTTPPTTQATTTTPPTTQATTSAISDEQLAAAAAVGDAAAGEEFFNTKLPQAPDSVSCSTCHNLDGKASPWAPTLAGVSAVAADRVAGMSDVDYLRQSIVDPAAFRVAGDWGFAMPYQYPDILSEAEINNLIAFLLTR